MASGHPQNNSQAIKKPPAPTREPILNFDKMPKFSAKIIIIATLLVGLFLWWSRQPDTIEVKLNNQVIWAEVAQTEMEKREGLMYREDLDEDVGMLFVYESPVPANFWMKNTLIPLDMIFIRPDKTINHIEKNAPPCPPEVVDCPSYTSHELTQYVLEVNAGYAQKHGIEPADVAEFYFNPPIKTVGERGEDRIKKPTEGFSS